MKDIHVLSFDGQSISDVSNLVNAVEYIKEYDRAIIVITAFDQTRNKILAITDTVLLWLYLGLVRVSCCARLQGP